MQQREHDVLVAGAVEPRRLGEEALDAAAAEARRVRESTRSWLTRWRAAPQRDYGDEIAILNKMLTRETRYRQVIAAGEELQVAVRSRLERADALLGLVAGQVAALVTEEHASLVRSCAGAGCTLWFLDRTRAHRRLFCSAMACGNRACEAPLKVRLSAAELDIDLLPVRQTTTHPRSRRVRPVRST